MRLAWREQLRPLDRDGVARIVEYASRLAGDGGQMSIEMRAIADVLREADQLAADAKRETIGAAEAEAAIDAKFRRGDRVYRRLLDEIAKKSTRVETEGAAVGQVNGLFVITFGAPPLASRAVSPRGYAWAVARLSTSSAKSRSADPCTRKGS